MGICRLNVQVRNQFIAHLNDFNIKKFNRIKRKIISKFDSGMKAIEMGHEFLEIFFAVFPNDEDIVNVSPPNKRL